MYPSLLVIGSFTCILCLYILCLMLITLAEWFCTVICNFIIFQVFIVKFYVQKRDFDKHMYSVFLK